MSSVWVSIGEAGTQLWTWISAVDPAWVSASAAAIGAIIALGVVVRWWVLRRDLRGSGASILALLGEPSHQALPGTTSSGRYRCIEFSSELVYFKVGTDDYLLCKRDLDRLQAQGYVYREDREYGPRPYRLSRHGRLLLNRYDNSHRLAKGVARAKKGPIRCLRCSGGLWLRCRCEKYWCTWKRARIRMPFPLARFITRFL